MHRLPSEILFVIFETCADGSDAQYQPIILSHVCHQWRSIALSDPSLWTTVQLHGPQRIAHTYLERSWPMPVDLAAICTAKIRGQIADFVEAQLSRMDFMGDLERVRSLDFVARSDEELDRWMAPLKGCSLPHLTSLRVEVQSRQQVPFMSLQWWAHQHCHTPLLPADTPKLSSIALVNKCTDCLGDTRRLTKLELHSFPGPFDCRMLEAVIQDSPLLETLVLGELDYLWHHPTENRMQVDVGQIKRLSIASSTFLRGRGAAFSPRCYCLLRNLVAGELECLEILGGHKDAVSHLLPSIKSREGSVPALVVVLR